MLRGLVSTQVYIQKFAQAKAYQRQAVLGGYIEEQLRMSAVLCCCRPKLYIPIAQSRLGWQASLPAARSPTRSVQVG